MSITRVLLIFLAAILSTSSGAQETSEPSAHGCRPGHYRFNGTVARGQTFSHNFHGFVFALIPSEHGWDIDISQGKHHYLANMTGPRHGVNSTEIEGWHFRNAANTGPNTGDVNAPDETRQFLFSPRWPRCEDAGGLEKDGQGVLDISDMELGNLREGEKANIMRMEFSVVLTVSRSACMACPGPSR